MGASEQYDIKLQGKFIDRIRMVGKGDGKKVRRKEGGLSRMGISATQLPLIQCMSSSYL
jgi:hypothetical protein